MNPKELEEVEKLLDAMRQCVEILAPLSQKNREKTIEWLSVTFVDLKLSNRVARQLLESDK